MYNITFYFYNGEIDIASKKEYSEAEALYRTKEEFRNIMVKKFREYPLSYKNEIFTEDFLKFRYEKVSEEMIKSFVSLFIIDLVGVYYTKNVTSFVVSGEKMICYLWDGFNNAFYGADYFEESIPILKMVEIGYDGKDYLEFEKIMNKIEKDRIYLEGEQKLVRCSFAEIEKDLIKRNIPDKEIQDYKDACSEPLDKVILRCPNCGCDRWETKRTDRVYMGDVDGEVDIIEDPYEDGELDEEMFCSKCSIALDRFNY